MTPTEITALARQYSEQNPPQCTDYKLRRNGIDLNAKMVFEPFLRWICEKYCVVEKEKVIDKYNAIVFLNEIGYQDRLDLLESLFGKELFNQAEQ